MTENGLPERAGRVLRESLGADFDIFQPEQEAVLRDRGYKNFRAAKRLEEHFAQWEGWHLAVEGNPDGKWFQRNAEFSKKHIHDRWGVYEIALQRPLDDRKYVVYVGKAKSLLKRINKYLANGDHIATLLKPFLLLGCSMYVRWKPGTTWNQKADFESLEVYALSQYDYAFNDRLNNGVRAVQHDTSQNLLNLMVDSRIKTLSEERSSFVSAFLGDTDLQYLIIAVAELNFGSAEALSEDQLELQKLEKEYAQANSEIARLQELQTSRSARIQELKKKLGQ